MIAAPGVVGGEVVEDNAAVNAAGAEQSMHPLLVIGVEHVDMHRFANSERGGLHHHRFDRVELARPRVAVTRPGKPHAW